MQCPLPLACILFRIKHTTFNEGETFLRNKQKIAFFFTQNAHFFLKKIEGIKCNALHIGKCELFRTKQATILEIETFLRNKEKIAFFFT